MTHSLEAQWPIRLFKKSVLKQRKFKEITQLLGDTRWLRCLDVGADNGVVSYLFRQRGGEWKSADLDEAAVTSIRELVGSRVYQVSGRGTPFENDEFDRIVIVDLLEHTPTDAEFVKDLHRILKPSGELVINVPHIKNSLLRRFRLAIGQTDEKHGHIRPGYTLEGLRKLLDGQFAIIEWNTYSKFFSECIDTCITMAVDLLKGGNRDSQKGVLVTGKDMRQYRKLFWVYSLIYPVVKFMAYLDNLLFWCSGYMLIVRTRTTKA